jgi:hypothetical protein
MSKFTVLWCFCVWFTGLTFMAQFSPAVTIDDAIGVWLFNDGKGETASDASKNGNEGKLMEGPKWVDGKFGGALSFDAEGPFVRIEVPSVQLSTWTAMIWINPNNPKAGHYQGLIQSWPNGGEFQIDGKIGIGDLYEVPPGFNYKFSGIVDEVAIFKQAIADDEIRKMMNDGLGNVLGLAAVSKAGKLTTTWGGIKCGIMTFR